MHRASLAIAFAASISAQDPAPAARQACAAPEHRQFDFWVGSWDVYPTGKNTRVARSRIEKLYSGCTIRENWMPFKGEGGGSLNMYDPVERRWRQTWQDSSNGRVVFEGGLVDGKMILTGFWKDVNGPGKDGLVRMTYSKLAGGEVRQAGEISTDHGLTWSPLFDLTYRRASRSN